VYIVKAHVLLLWLAKFNAAMQLGVTSALVRAIALSWSTESNMVEQLTHGVKMLHRSCAKLQTSGCDTAHTCINWSKMRPDGLDPLGQ